MRYCLALTFFAATMVLSSAAMDNPPGSYQQTCKSIKMHGDTLQAKCETRDGRWVRTSLDDADQCAGDITNIDGQLTCNRNTSPPEGTYAQSCKNIRVRYNTLYARCKTMSGQWIDTSLNDFNRCTGGIGNFDGQLRCGTGYGDGDRDRDRDHDGDRDRDRGYGPRGSYTQTCRDIQVNGYSLRARCQTSDGRWLDTSLDDYNQCVGEIVNDEGHLECTRGGGRSVPRGTYSQTCRQIYVRGDSLRAQCETRDGRWVWTQLNDWDNCNSISNQDGQLHCDR
jgi:hypothetical protein